MAYQGYLVKVGEYTIPKKFINSKTYSGYKNTLDMDSHRDGNGKLQREVLRHVPCKGEFETPKLKSSEFAEMMRNIKNNLLDNVEKNAMVTIFIPEDDDYITQKMYVPDVKPVMDCELNGELIYEPTRFSFVGY